MKPLHSMENNPAIKSCRDLGQTSSETYIYRRHYVRVLSVVPWSSSGTEDFTEDEEISETESRSREKIKSNKVNVEIN